MMKISVELNSDAATDLVEAWLRDYRDTCAAWLDSPLNQEDAIRTIAAIDILLADLTVPA